MHTFPILVILIFLHSVELIRQSNTPINTATQNICCSIFNYLPIKKIKIILHYCTTFFSSIPNFPKCINNTNYFHSLSYNSYTYWTIYSQIFVKYIFQSCLKTFHSVTAVTATHTHLERELLLSIRSVG